jgi:hypothetical protein
LVSNGTASAQRGRRARNYQGKKTTMMERPILRATTIISQKYHFCEGHGHV